MKGLNIKRIAAIGLGAALVGSALAPVVSAANVVPTGLDELGRDTVITATGAPAVDVVVGANASVSDVVWAGNIAARVAQLATKPVTCTADAGTVDLAVTAGSSTVASGSGFLAEQPFDWNAAEFNINVTNSDSPGLLKSNDWEIKESGTTKKLSIQESLFVNNGDAKYQSSASSSAYAPGAILGHFARESIGYRVDLGSGIKWISGTQLDDNTNYNLYIPWLGKKYTIVEMTPGTEASIVMYSDTTATTMTVGDSIPVSKSGSTSELTLQLVDMWVEGIGDQKYKAKWNLVENGVIKSTKDITSGSNVNLRNVFGSSSFSEDIYVTSLGKSAVNDKFFASYRSGSERVELKNGEVYPYNSSMTSTEKDQTPWRVSFNTTAAGQQLTSITLKNNWAYTTVSGSEGNDNKFALKAGEKIYLPENYGKFEFLGFENKTTSNVEVGSDKIVFSDRRDNKVELPLKDFFTLDANKIVVRTINNKKVSILYNDATKKVYYSNDEKGEDTLTNYVPSGWTGDVEYATLGDVVGPLVLNLGVKDKTTGNERLDTKYYIWLSTNFSTDRQAGLLMAAQQFEIYNKNRTAGKTVINFLGTDYNDINSSLIHSYYYPVDERFVKNTNVDYKFKSFGKGTYDGDVSLPAIFQYVDNASTDTNLFVNTRTGNTWNYESIKDNLLQAHTFPTKDAANTNWSSAIKDASSWMTSAFTQDGTMVESDSTKFVLSVPEELRNVNAFAGMDGTANVVPAGAQPFNGVAAGSSVSHKGTTVKVTAVNCGGSGASAVEVVPVSNLVKTAKGSGKSIIVGGWVANAAAANLEVSAGNTLEKLLINSGDYVAAVLASGDIVVAGFSGNDTGRAAQDLITALEGLM